MPSSRPGCGGAGPAAFRCMATRRRFSSATPRRRDAYALPVEARRCNPVELRRRVACGSRHDGAGSEDAPLAALARAPEVPLLLALAALARVPLKLEGPLLLAAAKNPPAPCCVLTSQGGRYWGEARTDSSYTC